MAEESRAADQLSRERYRRLGERIEALLTAMGEFLGGRARRPVHF
jgi:hypothetical protein